MSPSVLSYGNVDNDKVISTNTKMAEIPKRLNKTHRRFQNLALKWFQCLLVIIIHSNQSFNQSIKHKIHWILLWNDQSSLYMQTKCKGSLINYSHGYVT